MRLGQRRFILGALTVALMCALGIRLADGQQPATDQKPQMAEVAFKNIQVLKGIPVNQFMETMGFFSASLGVNCTYCHVQEAGGNWLKYADDTPHKLMARRMVLMMASMNKANFGGRRALTCYSCHRGDERPRVTPSLVDLYGPPITLDADEIFEVDPKATPADQILDKYLQAMGGAGRLGGLTSIVGKGTYQGYAEQDKNPVEIFAKAPNQRAVIVHRKVGDTSYIFDGKAGWNAAPVSEVPVQLVELSGSDLDAAKVDAELLFPGRIKQTFSTWRVGYGATIDDRDVQVVQGSSPGRAPVKFYFDKESGLLVRVVRRTDSPVGFNPTQIDYANYRDVAGVKLPFHWTVTWLDGRANIELSELRTNVPIDAARFAKPAAPR